MMTADRTINVVLLLIGVAGIAIASYLTTVHYAGAELVCSASGVVDCHQVLTSSYSEVLGLPVSIGGILWFAISSVLAGLALIARREQPWLQPAQVAWSLLGLVVVLYLVGVEVVAIERICLWCTSLHVLIVLTLLLTLFRTPQLEGADPSG